MLITKALRKWLVANCDIKDDSSDDECKEATAKAMVEGKLSAEKYAELTKDPKEEEANAFSTKLDKLADTLGKIVDVITPKEEEKKEEKSEEKKEEKKETPLEIKTEKKEISKMMGELGGTPTETGEKEFRIKVKEAADQYSTTTKALLHPETSKNKANGLAGRPVKEFGRSLMEPSDLAKAQAGVWAKFQILSSMRGKSPRYGFEALTNHEKELFCHLAEYGEWDDSKDKRAGIRKGFPGGYKALIDDSTSGGLEAAPIVFDDQVIQTPLLFGELFPLVNTITLDRGRRIEGVVTGTVTGSWGGVDDTAISLFNTASYVSALDTTIYRWEGSIQLGLDFLSDTPIDFGQHITQQYGNRLLEDLDDVIAVGDGTTQPQGVMNSGATAVAFGGSTSIGNYESLRFGVGKNEHSADVKASAVFCGTETSYQRARAINVGSTDARRLFGLDYDSYSIMQRPYKINESLTNAQIFYAILARYRMYRRRGFTVRTSMEGDTLMRQNEMLIVVMARYGGQMERSAGASITTTGEA
jgi:HK97 family phage major capsid protein